MGDGKCWDLSRRYSEFYEFYIAMLNTFPETAHNSQSLPCPPRRVKRDGRTVFEGLRHALDEYIQRTMIMPRRISASMLVRNFFNAKLDQDVKTNRSGLRGEHRSRQSVLPIRQKGFSRERRTDPASSPMSEGSAIKQVSFPQSQKSNLQSASMPSNMTESRSGEEDGTIKVNVLFRDNIVFIRAPQDVSYSELKTLLISSLQVRDDILIQYKEEKINSFIDLENDNHLAVARQRNPELTLHVASNTGVG